MVEVEIKLKIDSVDTIKSKLLALGFAECGTLVETDTYFDNRNGDIRSSDNALRIRKTVNKETGSSFAQINFKEKKLDNKSMSRHEYESDVTDAEAISHILEGLGYRPVSPLVIKTRRELKSSDINACIDTVEGLGDYLELETMTESEADRESALAKLEDVLCKLGYSLSDTTTTSYLSALQNLSGFCHTLYVQ